MNTEVLLSPEEHFKFSFKNYGMIYNSIEDIIVHIFFSFGNGFDIKEIDGISQIVRDIHPYECNEEKNKKEIKINEIQLNEMKEQLEQLESKYENKEIVQSMINDGLFDHESKLLELIDLLKENVKNLEDYLVVLRGEKTIKTTNLKEYIESSNDLSDSMYCNEIKNIISKEYSIIFNLPDNLNKEWKDYLDSTIEKLFIHKQMDMILLSEKLDYLKPFIKNIKVS